MYSAFGHNTHTCMYKYIIDDMQLDGIGTQARAKTRK